MSVKRRCGGARGRRRQESCVWMCDDGTSLLQRRTTEPVRRQTQSRAEIGEVHEADDVNEFDLLLVGDLAHAREWEQQWWIFRFFNCGPSRFGYSRFHPIFLKCTKHFLDLDEINTSTSAPHILVWVIVSRPLVSLSSNENTFVYKFLSTYVVHIHIFSSCPCRHICFCKRWYIYIYDIYKMMSKTENYI